ncbi:ribbon-helix-helix domain-containing protein [Natrinema sp. DC36]|uniref:ribbon-helix-helix domain-containing protein n=1 Tax=Natrinema sp. DC36 TaxID=2878680 RepID=UPI001CEFCDF4|nr:ribbon-helix-helix domain-containing protein [Natrinema sp. DC36]
MGGRQTFDDDVRVRITSERRKRLEQIAHARSEPGETVTPSHIVREALDEYLERLDSDETPTGATAQN